MKKILIGLLRYQIGHINASSISTDCLASYLYKKGLDTTVLCPKTRSKKKYKIKFYTSKGWQERNLLINIVKFINQINKIGNNYDIIYLILPNSAFAFVGDLIRKKTAQVIVRLECSLHYFENFKFSLNKIGIYTFLTHLASNKFLCRLARFKHQYLVSTNYQKKELISCGCPSTKITILPNTTEKFKPIKIKKTANIFSYIGHLNIVKGVPILIKAIDYLVNKKNIVNIKFQLASANNFYQKKYIVRMIKKFKIKQYITIKKFVKITDFLKNSKALILPYIYPFGTQLYPNLILEGIQLHQPIITTNIKPLTELLTNNKNCLMVKPNDEVALAKAILKLTKNEQLRKKIINNLKVLAKKVNPDKLNENHYKLFKQTVLKK